MEVILLERIKTLGDIGAVVSVKPGYARNFLIPQNKALRVSEANKKLFAERKSEIEAQSAARFERAQGINAIIDKNFITIIRQAGEDGKLFGSVSARDIANEISEKLKQQVSYTEVVLDHAVKYLGVHEITVHLHADVNACIYLNIARTETEAEDAKKAFLAPPKK